MILRIAILLLVGIACATTLAAQMKKCPMKIVDAPELRGFRLGMTIQDVKERADMWQFSLSRNPDETGFLEADFMPTQLLKSSDRPGLALLKLSFLDGRVVTVEARYDGSVKWHNVEEFGTASSEALDIPNQWQSQNFELEGVSASTLRMLCGEVGFAAIQPQGGSPALLVYRTDTKKIRDQRRSEAEEKRRRTFKP